MKKFFYLIFLLFFLVSCGTGELVSSHYSEKTLNHEFNAEVYKDKETGECQQIRIGVKPLAKLYTRYKPPSDVEFLDRDCDSPFSVEKVTVRTVDGERRVYIGNEVQSFVSEHEKMMFEMTQFLFKKGITKNTGPLK